MHYCCISSCELGCRDQRETPVPSAVECAAPPPPSLPLSLFPSLPLLLSLHSHKRPSGMPYRVCVCVCVCAVVHQTHLGASSESSCAPGSCWVLSVRCSSAASEEWELLVEAAAAAGLSLLKVRSPTLSVTLEDNY